MVEHALIGWGKCEQGFRRMAAGNMPAGIRSLVYGMSKGKAGIEGLSVLNLYAHRSDRSIQASSYPMALIQN